ncbi:hypothetical protein HYH02_004668 [Chlamydomonas schloesseri]|uniref:STI1/HOP DP domain-containing protein n=1 Tax=Chlamydomonas schloesseri TaxID=2026947 RepID=A0A836B915_9CHLO|nr:hypothetical protein HYH02_004668 [Chlamydomonas schloesseri]|eukprot:KAG2450834.1 hypothetical protein HYH02_004668 [Chlamydomonas schloesseri]
MLRSACTQSLGRRPAPFSSAKPVARGSIRAKIGGGPQMTPQQMEAMQQAMKDPAFAKRMQEMQEMMKRPEVQQQMAAMQAAMQNQALQQRMAALKDDPEFADIFADIQKGGMGALMKYYNDPEFLAKLGEKLGDVAPAAAGAPAAAMRPPPVAAAAAAPAEAPEINNIRDAAKYGDEEAVEDFIAIGKDLNEADAQGRTALHYAVAYDHPIIAKMLVDEGANLEARDSLNNTPLHYAAGYGRVGLARMLLDAGSDKTVQNNTGKTPIDLAKLDGRNPVNADAELIKRLEL